MVCIHSKNGFVSTSWGPALWHLIHTFSFRSDTDLNVFHEWFLLLVYTLPCGACRRNFKSNLKSAGYNACTSFASLENSAKFLWKFHNVVNLCLGKRRSHNITFRQAQKKYTCDRMKIVDTTINQHKWASGLDFDASQSSCSYINLWWFVMIVCVLNYPLTREDHISRGALFKRWLQLYIALLPTGEHSKFEHLDSLLHTPWYTWTRSMVVDHVIQVAEKDVRTSCTLSDPRQIIENFEKLRADSCTVHDSTEGTCEKMDNVIHTAIL